MSHHERLCTSVLSEQRRKRKALCSQITNETERCLFLTVRSTTVRPREEKPSSKRKNYDSRRWCSLQVPCLSATQNVTGRQRYNWKRRMRRRLYWRGIESDRKQRLKLRENRKVDTLGRTESASPCPSSIYLTRSLVLVAQAALPASIPHPQERFVPRQDGQKF